MQHYLFFCWWTLGLLPPCGCSEWRCFEHLWTSICSVLSALWGVHLGAELLGHIIILCSTSWGPMVSIAAPVYMCTGSMWGFLFIFSIFSVSFSTPSDTSYPNGCEVIAHASDVHFMVANNVDYLDFHVLIGHLCSSLENCLSQVLCPFLIGFLVLCC